MDTIESTRLLLRPLTMADASYVHRVVGNDPDMTWDHTSRDLEHVARTVRERIEHYEKHGFGVYGVIEKDSGEFVGLAGLQVLKDSADIELVVYTAKQRWRSGIAFEACIAALRYGFDIKGFRRIITVIREDNPSAQRLATKLGFRLVRRDRIYNTEVQVSEMRSDDFEW